MTTLVYHIVVAEDPTQDTFVREATPTDLTDLKNREDTLADIPPGTEYLLEASTVPVSVTVEQTRTVVDGNAFQVLTEVTTVTSIDRNIFVFFESTDAFSHVARTYDMETYPVGPGDAAFYRSDSATVSYPSIYTAERAAAYTLRRVDALVDAYSTYSSSFEGQDTHTYTAGE